MLFLPLLLTSNTRFNYQHVFPQHWYEYEAGHPKPLGLILGLTAVAIGQFFTCLYFYFFQKYGQPRSIQTKGARQYDFTEGLTTHLAQPGGFFILFMYSN